MKNILLVLTLAFLAAACAQRIATNEPPKQEKKSGARPAIEGFTGKTAVNTLQRAKPKIEAAGEAEKQKRQDLDELTKP